MNTSSVFSTHPDSPAADPSGERRRALLERQLERLDQMVQAGTDMIEAVAAQATGTGPKVVQGDVALAYCRMSRAVRMALLLQTRLLQEAAAPGAADDGCSWFEAPASSPQTVQDRKDLVEEIVEDITRQEGDDVEQAERIEREAAERLERDDLFGLVRARPVVETVADICRGLGLTPDWPTLAKDHWAQVERDTPDLANLPRSRQRAAEGGPSAEEPMVEGEGGARHAYSSPVRDSS
jgi:hypothetical protein